MACISTWPVLLTDFFVLQVFRVNDKLYIGLTGLATDVLTLDALLKFRCNMYKLRENREMKPETFSALVGADESGKCFEPSQPL